jgi:enoyl-CoA hydratase/carnithine racemase
VRVTKELVLTYRPFTAEEARVLRFVNRVVDERQLDDAIRELAAPLVQKSSSPSRQPSARSLGRRY